VFRLHRPCAFSPLQPWALVKEGKKERAGSVVGMLVNVIHLLGLILSPFMPATSDSILAQLQVPKRSDSPDHLLSLICTSLFPLHFAPMVSAGHKIGKPSVLFTLIEESKVSMDHIYAL
jgi:methionyl-tRNA synthetase